MLEQFWKKVVRRKSNLSWLLFPAIIFWLISIFYRLGFILFKLFTKPNPKLETKVVSVGNVSVGGTGKTPIVAEISKLLIEEGFRVGIVSSAYGRKSEKPYLDHGYRLEKFDTSEIGDEVKQLAAMIPEALFSINRIKYEAAKSLSDSGRVDLIIVDDGFQHFKLKRDINIVTYDAGLKLSWLKQFPLGVLREPLSALKRADIIIITRSKFATDITKIHNKIESFNKQAIRYHAHFDATKIIGRKQTLPVKYLEDKSVFLFAGIGNFRALSKQVRALCTDVDHALELSDHQDYTLDLLQDIKKQADAFGSDLILTTAKDWVKLENFDFGREIYYLNQKIDLDPGEEKLLKYLIDELKLKKQAK